MLRVRLLSSGFEPVALEQETTTKPVFYPAVRLCRSTLKKHKVYLIPATARFLSL